MPRSVLRHSPMPCDFAELSEGAALLRGGPCNFDRFAVIGYY